MIKNPVAIVAFLLALESILLFVSSRGRFERWFSVIPVVFWMYFLPMLASSVGLIDSKNPVYALISSHLLPMSLFLLLVTVDVRTIARLGKPALFMFFIGGVGIGAGMFAAFWLFKPLVGAQFWSGFGALAASWTGGSANMIAVKEALGTPDAVFLPMVVVDTIVPYVWMGVLVLLAGCQERFDRFNRCDPKIIDQIRHKMRDVKSAASRVRFLSSAGIIALAAAGGFSAKYVSQFLPVIKDVITPYAWMIIVVSLAGMALSFTPVRRIEPYGSTKIGYFILYLVLTSIGARASLAHAGESVVLIAAGFLVICIHVLFLLAGARLVRAPLFLVAVASQANVGGVASAPIVAEIYQNGFGAFGLLLAILGNIVGTYIGIVVGQACRLLS